MMDKPLDSAEHVKRYGSPPVDCDNTPLELGDILELVKNYSSSHDWVIGVKATFISCSPGDKNVLGVEFRTGRGGHALEGLLPESTLGQWVGGHLFRRLCSSATSLIPAGSEEEALVKLVGETTQIAFIGGKMFTVQMTPEPKADELVGKILATAAETIRKERTQAQAEVVRAKQALANAQLMPSISFQDVQNGVQVYKSEDSIVWFLPFCYAPKYISLDGKAPSFTISEEHQKKLLKKSLRLAVAVRGDKIHWVSLRRETMEDTFQHYHTDCLGSLRLPAIKTPADVFKFRDAYQKELETVNRHSLADDDPPRFPNIYELQKDALPIASVTKVGDEVPATTSWTTVAPVSSKFAIGEKVHLIPTLTSLHFGGESMLARGEAGVILAISSDRIVVDFPSAHSFNVKEQEIEKVE